MTLSTSAARTTAYLEDTHVHILFLDVLDVLVAEIAVHHCVILVGSRHDVMDPEGPVAEPHMLGRGSLALTPAARYFRMVMHCRDSAKVTFCVAVRNFLFANGMSAGTNGLAGPRGAKVNVVARDGVEPPTRGFSVRCSTN